MHSENISRANQKQNSAQHALLIDYEKVFDSIDGESLYKFLCWHGFPSKIINAIKIIDEGFQCSVYDGNHITDSFEVDKGVKQ